MRLNRAKWAGPNKIRLKFDPFAYRYVRLKVLVRDGYTCYWCGGPGDTLDHIIPWSRGGRTTMDNCICACQECNGLRGDIPADEYARQRNVPPPGPNGIPAARVGLPTLPSPLRKESAPVQPVQLPKPTGALPAVQVAAASDEEASVETAPVGTEWSSYPATRAALRRLLDPYAQPLSRRSYY
ncbi:MAG: HNH endonuclease [Mycobacterium leprae]